MQPASNLPPNRTLEISEDGLVSMCASSARVTGVPRSSIGLSRRKHLVATRAGRDDYNNSTGRNAVGCNTSSNAAEKLAEGLQQETEKERTCIRHILRDILHKDGDVDVFQVVLDAACKEVIVPSNPQEESVLGYALEEEKSEAAMAVVQRMRKDGLYVTSTKTFIHLYEMPVVSEVEEAVLSLMEPSVFRVRPLEDDALEMVILSDSLRKDRVIGLVLEHGPSMEERLEAGVERFAYVYRAAVGADLKTVQQMHDLLPLLPDGSGRRGELRDYAMAIDLVTNSVSFNVEDQVTTLEYLVEQAGGEAVIDEWHGSTLLYCCTDAAVEWLVERAPQLVEAACRQKNCLSVLATEARKVEFLVELMVELVDRKVLCDMMRHSVRAYTGQCIPDGWRRKLKPIHEAVPESMDGLRWTWLMEAINDKAYGDVEYMLGMCTREHLVMRNEKGDTAYNVAAKDAWFPRELLERLIVATKGSHA